MKVIGVDVSKDNLMVCELGGDPFSIPNTKQEIKGLLRKLPKGSTVAMEATGKYHRLLADTAHDKGFTVFVFNPKDTLYYAKGISPRAKTDKVDSKVIARYALAKEHRVYQPAGEHIDKLKSLVRTRATLVGQGVTLKAQMKEHPQIKSHLKKAVDEIWVCQKNLERQIVDIAKDIPEYWLLKKIKGFGELTAAYMAALLMSGEFPTSDAFVAYIGMDLRVSDSGKRKGKRILSKRGDPEARHLLYLAALSASQADGPYKDMRLRHLAKGYSKTEAYVYIARKLARVAWAVFTNKEEYRPERVLSQSGTVSQKAYAPMPSTDNGMVACVEGLPATQAEDRLIGGPQLLNDQSLQKRRKTA